MSRTAASPEFLPDVAAGVVVTEIALASASGKPAAPDWIKVGPRGAFTTRDGRDFSFDPEALVARFAADGLDLPIDLEHAISEKQADRDPRGWVKELAARPDGLYARVEWLESGKAKLAARTHRYVSPTFHHTTEGAATWVHSISLVSAPALPGAAICSAEAKPSPHPTETSMKGIASALGLNADANEQACLSALTALKAGTVDKKVHDEAIASLSAAKTELETIKAAERKVRVDGVIDGALKDKKITPAEKDAYVALCSTDAGLEQVQKLIAAKPATLSASGLDSRPAPAGGIAAADANPNALAAKALAHQAELSAKGVTISISEAVNYVASLEAR